MCQYNKSIFMIIDNCENSFIKYIYKNIAPFFFFIFFLSIFSKCSLKDYLRNNILNKEKRK